MVAVNELWAYSKSNDSQYRVIPRQEWRRFQEFSELLHIRSSISPRNMTWKAIHSLAQSDQNPHAPPTTTKKRAVKASEQPVVPRLSSTGKVYLFLALKARPPFSFFFFFIPFIYHRITLALPPSSNSDPGSHTKNTPLPLPPPHHGTCLFLFFREQN